VEHVVHVALEPGLNDGKIVLWVKQVKKTNTSVLTAALTGACQWFAFNAGHSPSNVHVVKQKVTAI
jgi:hypothetical protein